MDDTLALNSFCLGPNNLSQQFCVHPSCPLTRLISELLLWFWPDGRVLKFPFCALPAFVFLFFLFFFAASPPLAFWLVHFWHFQPGFSGEIGQPPSRSELTIFGVAKERRHAKHACHYATLTNHAEYPLFQTLERKHQIKIPSTGVLQHYPEFILFFFLLSIEFYPMLGLSVAG